MVTRDFVTGIVRLIPLAIPISGCSSHSGALAETSFGVPSRTIESRVGPQTASRPSAGQTKRPQSIPEALTAQSLKLAERSLFICEPVTANVAPKTADFGSGCSLWLQWALGFNPELIRLPRFSDISRSTEELKTANTRYTLEQASKLHSILGISHVALGKISAAGDVLELTYQVYELPAMKPLPGLISLKGTDIDIVAGLPNAAKSLCDKLGAKSPKSPPTVGATVADVALTGRFRRFGKPEDRESDRALLVKLGPSFPLATMLAYCYYPLTADSDLANLEPLAQKMLEQAPENTYVLGEVSRRVNQKWTRVVPQIVPLLANRDASVYWPKAFLEIGMAPNQKQLLAANEKHVLALPRSPTAWYQLAEECIQQSEKLRVGRVSAAVTANEYAELDTLYRRAKQAASKAVQLDPLHVRGWWRLAVASTFTGDMQRAEEALWKCISLDASFESGYSWGLQMFQPKWGGNPASLAKLAKLIVKASLKPSPSVINMCTTLRRLSYVTEAGELQTQLVKSARDRIQGDPQNAEAYTSLGTLYSEIGQWSDAIPVLKSAVKLKPNDYSSQYPLGVSQFMLGQYNEAVEHLRTAFKVNPSGRGKEWLATALREIHEFGEAETLFREMIAANPNFWQNHNILGNVLMLQGRIDDALAECLIALRLGPERFEVHQELCNLYVLTKKYDLAIQHGEISNRISRNNFWLLMFLAQAYAGKGDKVKAKEYADFALPLAPPLPRVHLEKGKLHILMGNKIEAVKELNAAIKAPNAGPHRIRAEELLSTLKLNL